MPSFIFRCPHTHYKVQGFVADKDFERNPNIYEPILCAICQHIHLISPTSGKVLGDDDE